MVRTGKWYIRVSIGTFYIFYFWYGRVWPDAGFTVLVIGDVSPGVTMLKIMQVPKAELENVGKLIKRLDHSIKHSN